MPLRLFHEMGTYLKRYLYISRIIRSDIGCETFVLICCHSEGFPPTWQGRSLAVARKQARRINLTATRQTSNSSVGSIHESPARTLRTNGTATCRNVRPNKPSPAGEGGPPNALRMAVDEVLRSIRAARTAGVAHSLREVRPRPTMEKHRPHGYGRTGNANQFRFAICPRTGHS